MVYNMEYNRQKAELKKSGASPGFLILGRAFSWRSGVNQRWILLELSKSLSKGKVRNSRGEAMQSALQRTQVLTIASSQFVLYTSVVWLWFPTPLTLKRIKPSSISSCNIHTRRNVLCYSFAWVTLLAHHAQSLWTQAKRFSFTLWVERDYK